MQDIYIEKIRLKNCRCHHEMEMDFPIDNFTLILGKNGAGKSTIPKAVCMALYGDDGSTKGDRLTIADMVNDRVKKDLEIVLNFKIVDGEQIDNYEIQLYQEHRKFHNKFFLLKNGVDVSGKTKTETYEIIEHLLYPRDVFLNTVYFTQQVKDFFTSLTNTEQKMIFDAILSTQDYRIFYTNVDKSLKKINEENISVDSSLNTILTSVDIKKQSIAQFLESKQKAVSNNEIILTDLIQKKVQKENELQVQQDKKTSNTFDTNKVDSLNNLLYRLQSEKEDIQITIDNGIAKLNKQQELDISTKKSELLIIKSQTRKEIGDKFNKESANFNSQLNTILVEISNTEKQFDTSSLFKDHNSFSIEKQKEIDFVNKEISGLDSLFSTVSMETEKKERIRIIESNIQDLMNSASKVKETVAGLKSKISELEKIINEDTSKLNAPTSICSKCYRPFTDFESTKMIRQSIDLSRLEVKKMNSTILIHKTEMDSLKSKYDEALVLKSSTDISYTEKIQEIINKKLDQSSILIRKRELLQSEIVDHKKRIDSEIHEMLNKKEAATFELKKKCSSIESKISETNKLLETKFNDIEYNYTKDVESITQEHIKKYDVLREKCKLDFNSQEIILSSQIDKINMELAIFEIQQKELVKLNESIQTLNTELKICMERIIECQNFTYDDTQIQKLSFDVAENESVLKNLTDKKKSIQRENKILEFWKESFSDTGIKSMLIDMAIPHMNQSVAQALEKIVPGMFTVSFDTLKMTKSGDVRDKFNVNILHNIKGTNSHKKLSGGEKRLVDLCCMEALKSLAERLYGKKIHNVFYDEVLDSLDDDSCQAFGQASRILSEGKNITLIAHKAAENVEPDRVFTL